MFSQNLGIYKSYKRQKAEDELMSPPAIDLKPQGDTFSTDKYQRLRKLIAEKKNNKDGSK